MNRKNVIIKKYKHLPEVFFFGTDAEINEAEQEEAEAIRKVWEIVTASDFCALKVKRSGAGAYILHRSTRSGVAFQLSVISSDGIPAYHENIKDFDDFRRKGCAALFSTIYENNIIIELLTA